MFGRTWCLCAVLWLGGCAPGNPGLVIAGVVSPNDSCDYDTGNALLSSGVLDVASERVDYHIVPLYFSQLLNLSQSGSSGPPMADPNVLTVQEAQVELRDLAGEPLAFAGLPNPFTVPATGFVPSSDGTAVGEGLGLIEIVPALYGEALRDSADQQIVASVRAIGVTAGGAEVITSEFNWPITLCSGCLFACMMSEDVAVCRPSCTPGQDELSVVPGACADPPVLAGCLSDG